MRSPICWFGGKGPLAKKLVPLFPEHETYVEVFGGAASLLFGKYPSPLEVYNDLDAGLVNFFRVLRDPKKFAQFCHLASLTLYSREEWEFCRDTWENCEDEIERAYRWFVVARQSFSGIFGHSWGFTLGKSGHSVSAWDSNLAALPAIHERFRLVQVEHRDFRDIFSLYDREEAFFYCDPPYIHDTRRSGGYVVEMADQDHKDLVAQLLQLKGKAMLSGYAHPIYATLEEAGWRRQDFKTVCHAVGKTRTTGLRGKGTVLESQARVESIWMNYDLANPLPLGEGAIS